MEEISAEFAQELRYRMVKVEVKCHSVVATIVLHVRDAVQGQSSDEGAHTAAEAAQDHVVIVTVNVT